MMYQLRYLLAIIWVSQLAWLCAPVVEASDDLGSFHASYRPDLPQNAGNCGNSWAADDCGTTLASWADDDRAPSRRVQPRDIAQTIIRNLAGDELDLLHLKQRANFKPYARHLGASKLDMALSVTSNGSQVRLHTAEDDGLAVSFRSGNNAFETRSTVVGLNLQICW